MSTTKDDDARGQVPSAAGPRPGCAQRSNWGIFNRRNWGVFVRRRQLRSDDPLDAVRGAGALVVCTEWPQYRNIGAREITAAAPRLLVLDANRFLPALASAKPQSLPT